MTACAGVVSFFSLAGLFVLALVLMRVGAAKDPRPDPPAPIRTVVPIVRAKTRPFDWEREGI
jgi:hypothetical protein